MPTPSETPSKEEEIFQELKKEILVLEDLFAKLESTQVPQLEVKRLEKKYAALVEAIKKIEDSLFPDIIA